MTSSLRVSLALWRSAGRGSTGDRVYTAYAVTLVAAMAIPVALRGAWALTTDPRTAAALAPHAGAASAMTAVGACALVALLAGRVRGPVVLAPFLAFALGHSPIPRVRAYAAPFLRALLPGAAAGVLAAVVPMSAWSASGVATPVGTALFLAVGAACGACTAVVWLVGQTMSAQATMRATTRATMLVGVLAFAPLAVPTLWPLSPLGWVGLTFASAGRSVWAVAFVALAAAAVAAAPLVWRRLDAETVLAQSLRWRQATAHVRMLDLDQAADTYAPTPHRGRGIPALRASPPLPWRLLRVDAVATLRTPGRAVTGALALAAAGCLVGVAAAASAPWLSAVAGVVAYTGAGPFADGVRHAAETAAGTAMYGSGDLSFLAAHAVLPLSITALVLAAAATATGGILAAPIGAGVAAGAVGCRVLTALKGPMPIGLLMPVPTPAGDAAALLRLAWALDAVILAAAVGAGVAIAVTSPWPLLLSTVAVFGLGIRRWRGR